MRKLIYIFGVLVLTLSCKGQAVQELEVRGFSSGLINSLPDELIPDDAAIILENYDVTSEGFLTRRKGLTAYYPESSPKGIYALAPFYQYDKKSLLMLRLFGDNASPSTPGYYGQDSADLNIQLLMTEDHEEEQCSTFVYDGFYWPYRDPTYPYNMSAVTMNNNIAIATTNSEAVIYDGDKAFPARPLGPGQARVAVINGGGNVSGRVSYKYCYLDNDASDTSNFSAPTWTVQVKDGKVFIYGFTASGEAAVDSILIFRSKNGGNYEQLTNIANSSSATYFDNTLLTSAADTTTYDGGAVGFAWSGTYALLAPNFDLIPPGGMSSSVDTSTLLAYGAGMEIDTAGMSGESKTKSYVYVQYSIVYIDSAGRESYIGTGTPVQVNQYIDYGKQVTLSDIPAPSSGAITKKLVLKCIAGDTTTISLGGIVPNGNVYVIDTLDPDETTCIDSIRYDSMVARYPVWCEELGDYADYFAYSNDMTIMPEQSCYDDSTIAFQPSDIAIRGFRAFAIGDYRDKNRLWYSDFGRFSTWPNQNYLPLGSGQGDWPVRIIALQKTLYIFKQNSILRLSGLSFYQFSLDLVSQGVGLAAPKAVAVTSSDILYLSKRGVFDIGAATSNPQSPPLSLNIDRSIDSAAVRISRAWAGMIGNEFWLSLPVDSALNNKTYIFSQTPRPHWKAYDFGVIDGAAYDSDTGSIDFDPSRWVFALPNDTLWRWGYSEDDTIDGSALITATYQSKFFFGDLNREKVYYLDVIGKGLCDSLRFIFYNKKGDSATGAVITPVDTVITHIDFYSQDRQRIKVDHVFNSFSVRIEDFGTGTYQLKGFVIGYQPWDRGRKRP